MFYGIFLKILVVFIKVDSVNKVDSDENMDWFFGHQIFNVGII